MDLNFEIVVNPVEGTSEFFGTLLIGKKMFGYQIVLNLPIEEINRIERFTPQIMDTLYPFLLTNGDYIFTLTEEETKVFRAILLLALIDFHANGQRKFLWTGDANAPARVVFTFDVTELMLEIVNSPKLVNRELQSWGK